MTADDLHLADSAEPDESEDDPEDVDVDLDAMGREATGDPTRVKLDGVVIHVAHAGDWSSSAMRAASMGDWDTWAREVIDDDREYQIWEDADLRNTQIEAVFQQCGRAARLNAGKSQRRGGSRRSSRRR